MNRKLPAIFIIFGIIAMIIAPVLVNALELFERIPEAKVNSAELDKAQNIFTTLNKNWANDIFDKLPDDFTAEMQKALTPELQKNSFQQIRTVFGDLQELTFFEALRSNIPTQEGNVFRFKGHYSKASSPLEIRIVIDRSGKISGLWLKPWADKIQ